MVLKSVYFLSISKEHTIAVIIALQFAGVPQHAGDEPDEGDGGLDQDPLLSCSIPHSQAGQTFRDRGDLYMSMQNAFWGLGV